jgi:uncharacterized protein
LIAAQETETLPETEAVPWDARDAWLGAGLLFFVMLGLLVFLYFLPNLDMSLILAGSELALLVPVWWLAVRKYGASWRTLGLRKFTPVALGIGCGLMILSWGFNLVYSLFLALFNARAQPDFSPIFADASFPWLILVAGAVIAPFVEEIIFRGFIFAGFKARYGWVKAAVLSSGLFAIIHFQPLAIIGIFLMGMIFAFLYHYSGSIWPAIIMHMSTNLLALGAALILARFPELAGV